uniref:Uncharacterized protein n=1 Tax=Megaselia scalaris TaxID=36166 RepID=T1GSS5_MEGSC
MKFLNYRQKLKEISYHRSKIHLLIKATESPTRQCCNPINTFNHHKDTSWPHKTTIIHHLEAALYSKRPSKFPGVYLAGKMAKLFIAQLLIHNNPTATQLRLISAQLPSGFRIYPEITICLAKTFLSLGGPYIFMYS